MTSIRKISQSEKCVADHALNYYLFHFFKICPIDKNLDFCVWVGANSPPPNKVGLSEKSLGIHTFNSVRRTVRRTKTNSILT